MTWIKAAAEAASYRRMYELAAEIAGCELASGDVRRAAKRVVRVLEGVIDMPIADAALLAGARSRFAQLAKILARVPRTGRPTDAKSPGQPDRAMGLQ